MIYIYNIYTTGSIKFMDEPEMEVSIPFLHALISHKEDRKVKVWCTERLLTLTSTWTSVPTTHSTTSWVSSAPCMTTVITLSQRKQIQQKRSTMWTMLLVHDATQVGPSREWGNRWTDESGRTTGWSARWTVRIRAPRPESLCLTSGGFQRLWAASSITMESQWNHTWHSRLEEKYTRSRTKESLEH